MRKFVVCTGYNCSYLSQIRQLLTVGVQKPFRNYADKTEDPTPENKVSKIREYLKEKKMQQIRELRNMRKELIKARKELEKKLNKPKKFRSFHGSHVLKAVYSIKINRPGSRIRINPRNEEVAMPCHEHLRSFMSDVGSSQQQLPETAKLTTEHFADQVYQDNKQQKSKQSSSVKIGFSFRKDCKPVFMLKDQRTLKQLRPDDRFVKQSQAISNSSICNTDDNPRIDMAASSSLKKSLVQDLMRISITKLKPYDMSSIMLRTQSPSRSDNVRCSKLKKITFTSGLPKRSKIAVPASVLDNIEIPRKQRKTIFLFSDPSLRKLVQEIAQYRMASSIVKALLEQKSKETNECNSSPGQLARDTQSEDR